jgi:putative intracellular protease/amidase
LLYPDDGAERPQRPCPVRGFGIRTDLRNADAKVVEEEVVVDGNLVTSRSPSDLPAFCSTIVKQLTHAPAGA